MIVISKLSYQFQSFLHHMNQPKVSFSILSTGNFSYVCVFYTI